MILKMELEKENGLNYYNLGTGHGYSVLEMIETFKKVNKVDVPYTIKPRREGDIAECYADSSKAEKELGFKTQYKLEDMCASAWNFVVKNK